MAERVLRRPGNVVFREEEDGAILFNSDDGSVFMLEDLGWAIYHNHIDKGATRSEMLRVLREKYPAEDPAAVERDLDTFLDDLRKAACVEETDS